MKNAFIILLIAAFVLLLIEYIRYRRQIVEICRQLAFHHDEKTNSEIRVNLGRQEILGLQNGINEIFEDSRKERVAYMTQESRSRELIADLSHDIRTPLTSLDGYFNLLKSAELDSEREKYIGIISGRLNILSDLLEQLFTYAKLQNGYYKLELDSFDCTQTLCETLLSFYEEFRSRGITPEISIPEEECIICGNKTAFVRIVQNILRNALVHGGNIQQNKRLSVEMNQGDSSVEFIFRNGMGEGWNGDIERVFDRFYTGDKSRTTHSSGLGLPVAKKLTEAMNGKISAKIDSEDFVITLEFTKFA